MSIQFDEPAFNVFMDEVAGWGIEALHRAIDGLKCTTAVHICYGYGIKANIDWKKSLGGEWRQYEEIFPALAKSRIGQVSVECINSRVPLKLLSLLEGKDVLIGVIDVASDEIETPERVAQVIGEVMKFVPKEKIVACTNCGMAPMRRDIAEAKLIALGKGAKLARQRCVEAMRSNSSSLPRLFPRGTRRATRAVRRFVDRENRCRAATTGKSKASCRARCAPDR